MRSLAKKFVKLKVQKFVVKKLTLIKLFEKLYPKLV